MLVFLAWREYGVRRWICASPTFEGSNLQSVSQVRGKTSVPLTTARLQQVAGRAASRHATGKTADRQRHRRVDRQAAGCRQSSRLEYCGVCQSWARFGRWNDSSLSSSKHVVEIVGGIQCYFACYLQSNDIICSLQEVHKYCRLLVLTLDSSGIDFALII